MPPKPKFSQGEKVLCYESDLLQEAQCLQVKVTEHGRVKYLIHYIEWHDRWDEWVLENRLVKYSEENVAKQKQLYMAHRAKTTPTKRSKLVKSVLTPNADAGPSTSSQHSGALPQGTKRKHASPQGSSSNISQSETTEQGSPKCDIKMPAELRAWLVEDRQYIVTHHMLMNLPAAITVNEIFNNYIDYKRCEKDANPNVISCEIEITNCIKKYFDGLFETQVLYQFEKLQLKQLREQYPDRPMSAIYGPIHLLRFFFRMGEVFKGKNFSKKVLELLQDHVHAFLNYLVEFIPAFFSMEEYAIPPLEYYKKYLECEKEPLDFDNVSL